MFKPNNGNLKRNTKAFRFVFKSKYCITPWMHLSAHWESFLPLPELNTALPQLVSIFGRGVVLIAWYSKWIISVFLFPFLCCNTVCNTLSSLLLPLEQCLLSLWLFRNHLGKNLILVQHSLLRKFNHASVGKAVTGHYVQVPEGVNEIYYY